MKSYRHLPYPNNSLARIALTLIIVALLGMGIYFGFHQNAKRQTNPGSGSSPAINYGPPSSADKTNGNQQSNAAKGTSNSTPSTPNAQPPVKSNPTASIYIARAAQQINNGTQAGQPVSVRTVVNGTTTGQCVITFSLNGHPSVVNTVNLVMDPTYYSCTPLDLPASDFSGSGTWALTVYVTSNGSVISNTANQAVNIQR